jgi:hypothetical protein
LKLDIARPFAPLVRRRRRSPWRFACAACLQAHPSGPPTQRKQGADTTTAPGGAVVAGCTGAKAQRKGTVRVEGFDAGELKPTEPPMRVAAV